MESHNKTQKETSANPGKDGSNDMLRHNNFKRSPHGKILLNDDAVVAKKLSFTPSPTNISSKRQKKMSASDVAAAKSCLASPESTSTMVTRGKLHPRPFRPHIFKSSGGILPKYVKCTFRPTVDMRLTAEEAILCAYIFRDDFQSKNEPVFSMGDTVFIRFEFQSLVLGGYVGRQTDVQSGFNAEKLVVIYMHDWMPAFKKLKLIYVPIVDEVGHWCLMVVHIVERKIYLLDYHLVVDKVEERHRLLKQIVSAHVSLLCVCCLVLTTITRRCSPRMQRNSGRRLKL
ncbi:Ulp1 protease family, carboxy-terminal domain protein [Medicago truncatula]|uniref:Ulp1 protease family, carboxy-terminal domain protein n=1 Tax=Medicago truncatula TaxID=3880 RepID=G7KK53_MEDTR|nr:Ulp1 protease family, carboxy-terminal domain protein [Medicago truncatula]